MKRKESEAPVVDQTPKKDSGAEGSLSDSSAANGQNPQVSPTSLSVSQSHLLERKLIAPHQRDPGLPRVSIIIPCYNAMPWLEDCLRSCCVQDFFGPLEVSVYDDNSSDGSSDCIQSWEGSMKNLGISLVHGKHIAQHDSQAPFSKEASTRIGAGGAGRARNEAIKQSSGEYLCFLDADDVMLPDRISRQLAVAQENPHAIIGGGFVREPTGATEHYSRWANSMDTSQLVLEQFREITVILPTWFFSRVLFDRVGGFTEASPEEEGEAEDLTYFHRHLSCHLSSPDVPSPPLLRVGDAASPVLMYRFLASSSSWRTPRRKLLRIRVHAFEHRVLNRCRDVWERFTVWGAGRDARQFISELSEAAAGRVRAMCDVDDAKVGKEYFNHRSDSPNPPRIPIIHFTEARGPVVVCVSKRRFSDDLDSELLKNVATLGLTEGHDLWFFI